MIVVTGANRGIGLAIARQLSAAGCEVLGTARDPSSADALAELPNTSVAKLDVADAADVDRFVGSLPDGLEALVNNAGVALDGFDADVAARTLAVNYHGVRRLTDRVLPKLAPHARVVMVSSGMGEVSCLSRSLRAEVLADTLTLADIDGLADRFVADVAAGRHAEAGWPSSAYRVSKVLLNASVRAHARRLRDDPRGLMVNAACPGWVATDMGGASAPRTPNEGARTPVWLATLPPDGPTGGFFRDERPADW